MNISEIGEIRLKKVLEMDKKENPKRVCEILKSEIKSLLESYMELTGIEANFNVNNNEFHFTFEVDASKLKQFRSIV